MKSYIAFFEYVPGENGFGVIVPDIPGFSSGGDTYEESVKNATEGLASHIDVMKEHGEKITAPRTLEQIKKEWQNWKEWEKKYDFHIGHIPVLPPYGTQKVLLSIDTALVARIDRVAKNRSAFFASAAERFFEEKTIVSAP
ncbi:MAG: type II toxin-antitoxin system HicB family antitoxin [Treponema sp.]|jgi:predicted RNase H-like HicB family nuclease|nr:type II toxin-antitoxin system HicB family antitoxin [Treponema sp.]